VDRRLPVRRGGQALTAAFLLGVCGCTAVSARLPSDRPDTRWEPGPQPTANRPEVGLASWYGDYHHGQRTASGEVFDMRQLTAAHRTLPLGTRLRVTNLHNGRMVRVRVNDRGPYVPGRVLDLSREAARVLDMVERGVVPVRLDIVGR
jgi:rare lipoprotein A (peptidoglycan hydrolase)